MNIYLNLVLLFSAIDLLRDYHIHNYKSSIHHRVDFRFFVICIILSIVVFLSLLQLNLQYQLKSIELASIQYREVFTENHIKILQSEMNSVYEVSKANLTTSTIILVAGLSISFLSLIPYQRKMILEYNKY